MAPSKTGTNPMVASTTAASRLTTPVSTKPPAFSRVLPTWEIAVTTDSSAPAMSKLSRSSMAPMTPLPNWTPARPTEVAVAFRYSEPL